MEREIGVLHQQAAIDALVIQARQRGIPGTAFKQTYVLLFCNGFCGFVADPRCDDDFDELPLDDGFCGFTVEFAVERDDAAKG